MMATKHRELKNAAKHLARCAQRKSIDVSVCLCVSERGRDIEKIDTERDRQRETENPPTAVPSCLTWHLGTDSATLVLSVAFQTPHPTGKLTLKLT